MPSLELGSHNNRIMHGSESNYNGRGYTNERTAVALIATDVITEPFLFLVF